MGIFLGYSYQTMPKSNATADGMKIIDGNTEKIRATLSKDIVYAIKDGKELHLRILKPESIYKEEEHKQYPLLVHVQGSGYLKQNMNDHILDFKEIVEAGYMVAIVQYRESTIVKIPGQVYDVKDALRYIAKHSEDLGIDMNRIYLSGDSSGGHAALMCWATLPTGQLDESTEPLPSIRAVMDFYGAVDMVDMLKYPSAYDHSGLNSAEGFALGYAPEDPEMAEKIKKTSVLSYIHKDSENVPLLVLHGNKDRSVPFEQSVLLYNTCKEAGKDITFYCINNSDHGGSAFYCPAVYDIIIDFLNNH